MRIVIPIGWQSNFWRVLLPHETQNPFICIGLVKGSLHNFYIRGAFFTCARKGAAPELPAMSLDGGSEAG